MPITELAILQLLPPYEFHSPHILQLFRTVSTRQSAFSKFSLYYFADVADKSIIYLISGWDDVDSHKKWIASDENQELLRLAAPYLKVPRLFHLDIDFTGPVVQNATIVVVRKCVEKLGDKVEYVQGTPSWTWAGADLESGSEATKYEVSAYEIGIVEETARGNIERPDNAMVMERLSFPEDT